MSVTVSVEVVDDNIVEGDELFFVRLVRAPDDVSGIQLSRDTASVIIKDNDGELISIKLLYHRQYHNLYLQLF